MVKDSCKDAKQLLHTIWLGLGDRSIVGIKVRHQVLYQQVK